MDAILGFIGMIIRVVIIIAIVLAVVAVWSYNSLRKLAENVKESESNIDIALRKKVSLVNQLIDVAGKYMDRESLVMLKVSQDTTSAAMAQVYQQSGTTLATIQGMVQKFPDLKASEQYSNLAGAIAHSESEVQQFRLQYNAAIKEYNSKRSALPHALYAGFLGFKPGRYLELEAVESSDSSVQKQIIADDGDRLNELLGMAGAKMIGATKTVAAQGKLMAEKAATRVQNEIAARTTSAPATLYHYLDASKAPQGPVSREELDGLYQSGAVAADTDVLESGAKTWTKYSDL
jgi:LemA protein